MIGRVLLAAMVILAGLAAIGCKKASAADTCFGGSCAVEACAAGDCLAGDGHSSRSGKVFRPAAHEFMERGPVRRFVRRHQPVRQLLRGTVRGAARVVAFPFRCCR